MAKNQAKIWARSLSKEHQNSGKYAKKEQISVFALVLFRQDAKSKRKAESPSTPGDMQ
jgi:hypothetical protein